jgi:hypothetical protein
MKHLREKNSWPYASPLAEDEGGGYPQQLASVGDLVALAAPPSGGIWVAHKCGAVDRYSNSAQRVGSTDCGPMITAMACVGRRIWVGFADGMIRWAEEGAG